MSVSDAEPVPDAEPPRRVICTVPTYNEAQNVLDLARELLALGAQYQVLVIDDDSPDGTWKLVRHAAEREPRLHLLHRTKGRGRGAAGRAGFLRALELGADVIVELDADFSHQPVFVPSMIARLHGAGPGEAEVGLVIGSRGVRGGSDADRGILRQWITVLANAYIRVLLGISVRDGNSGFRCWRASTLRALRVEQTFSVGPAIIQELLFRTARAGIPIAEVPIDFVDRQRGRSTLSVAVLMQGYTTVLKLRWLALRGRL